MAEIDKKKSIAGTKISPTPKENVEIGIDTDETIYQNILSAAINEVLDISKLEGFSNISQTREGIYKTLDSMSNDSIVSSILETYTEDTVQTNEYGNIMWCESSDPDVAKYVTYLLDSMGVDKHLYGWTHSLLKYGDLYLRLYRQSDYEEDALFSEQTSQQSKILTEKIEQLKADDEYEAMSDYIKEEVAKEKNDSLKEDVNLIVHKKDDHYVHYIEAVANPGEMFELTRFGKTAGYVSAPTKIQSTNYNGLTNQYVPVQYQLKRGDVNIYSATDFVHAALENTSSRQPEEVQIFLEDDPNKQPITYKVRRGQSLLYNTFKIWRELSLLENSVILNRVTKSSIFRIIQVEVGDMPKENVANHLHQIKNLLEQKTALNTGLSMSEYSNAGPIENNIYVPTHGGIGSLSTEQIGGDVDPKQLTDINHFQDKFFGAFRIPKQFFGVTDDAAGFNGGSSLSIISSRYGKAVKRTQNTLIQALTDVVNLMLLDKGLSAYVNKFSLKMQAPITQEEIDRKESASNQIRIISDIMNTLTDIETPTTRLKILKALLASSVSDSEVLALIQEEIDRLELKEEETPEDEIEETSEETEENEPAPTFDSSAFEQQVFGEEPQSEEETEEPTNSSAQAVANEVGEETDNYLPSPSDLGVDMTQNQ